VAHRLSLLRDVDHIFVFDSGKLVDQGPYSELLRHDGLFTQLVKASVAA
jgi:ABC-type multidrug transport system fused ATPase/permease subunit